jgi:hypothetical protein
VLVLGLLRLDAQVARLNQGCQLDLLRPREQGAGLGEAACFQRGAGLLDQLGRLRVVRLERGQVLLGLGELAGDLEQALGDLVLGDVLLAEDAEEGLGGRGGDAELGAESGGLLLSRPFGRRRSWPWRSARKGRCRRW